MGSPTRYKNGVTNVSGDDAMRMLQVPDPTLMHVYYNDFDEYNAGDWTITAVGTGTSAIGAIDGGALVVTCSALDNDARQHQHVANSFTLTAGKKCMFKARFKVSDATQSDFLIGLATLDTTVLTAGGSSAGDGVTDGVFFEKDDGSTAMFFNTQKDVTTGQTSAASVHTVVTDTFVTVAWYYDGKASIEYYVDNVKKGTLDASSTFLPDASLAVSFAIMNGEAVAKAMTIDYVLVANER